MDYHELGWGELRSFAKSQDIDTKGLKRIEILEALDSFNDLVKEETFTWVHIPCETKAKLEPFKGVKSDVIEDDEPKPLSKEWEDNLVAEAKQRLNHKIDPHPLFKEIEPYLPHLKAYAKLKAVSNVEGISEGIAVLFMKHIEEDKRAPINLGCGPCRDRYYKRMIQGYNKLAEKYGEPTI